MDGLSDAVTFYCLFLFLVYVQRVLLAHICMYTPYRSDAHRGQKMVSNPQKLEL